MADRNVRHYFLTLASVYPADVFLLKQAAFLFGVVLLLSSHEVAAQRDIVLTKGNTIVVKITEGEYIRFKRKDRDYFDKGFIAGIHLDYFRVGEDTVYIYDVEKIDMRGRPNVGFKTAHIGVAFIIAGTTLFLGDLITVTAVQGQEYTFNRGVTTVAAALVGTGVAMQFINNEYFKIGRKKKITIMDH